MRTETLNPLFDVSNGSVTAGERRPSMFRRVMDALSKAQEARARQVVDAYLSRCDDTTLADLGWTNEQIAKLRAKPASGTLYI